MMYIKFLFQTNSCDCSADNQPWAFTKLSQLLHDINIPAVHDRPQVLGGQDMKQPRRDNLLRPRWPEEFVVEPVQIAKYGIVSLETGALAHKAVKVI